MHFFGALPGAVAQGLIWGIMALGVMLSYKTLDFADLTVDGSFCTGGAVCVVLIRAGVPWAIALLCALASGFVCGAVTALLHTAMGIPGILAGILTQLALYSVNLAILGGANLPLSSRSYKVMLSASDVGIAIGIMAAVTIVVVGVLYWYFGTQRGCAIRATGCNEVMARAQGINTSVCKVTCLALSNGLVALSGALLAQYQGFADINMGRGAIVIGLAAVIIGGVIVSGIGSNFAVKMAGVAVGSVVYFVVIQAAYSLGLPTDYSKLVSAVVVALFLTVPYFKQKIGDNVRNRRNRHTEG